MVKDRKAIALTRVSWPLAKEGSVGSSVATSIPPLTPPSLPKAANDESAPTSHPRPPSEGSTGVKKPERLHSWEHTTDLGKVVFANRALAQGGRAYAFTVNLGPAQIKAANDNAKGFADHFKRRISRTLKRAGFDVPYWFAVDVTKTGRLHIHGGLEANDNNLDAVKEALRAAGGAWKGLGRQFQCHVKPMVTPDVWANYCLRNQAKVRRLVRGRSVSITTVLRRRGKALYRA